MKGFIKFIKEIFKERTDKDGYPIKGYDIDGNPVYKGKKTPQKPICKTCGRECTLNDTKNYKGEDVKRYYCLICWSGVPSRTIVEEID